jgi:hypothetical protein
MECSMAKATRAREDDAAVSRPALPPLLPVGEIEARLKLIFPAGTPNREYIVRKYTVRTVFACLYIGAIAGQERWLAPRHVYRMRDSLAEIEDPQARMAFYKKPPPSQHGVWYADNSREGARDEGVRRGLIPLNAMVTAPDIMGTSSKGRYALSAEFAALLDPALNGRALQSAAQDWGALYLSPAARARAALLQGMDDGAVEIKHPQGGSTVLPGGESPSMTKAAVEVFAALFLTKPALVWISDSRRKYFHDDRLVKVLDLKIDAARLLPDLILVDTEPAGRKGKLLIIFVEIVFTDGAIDEGRKQQLLELLARSSHGYNEDDAAFVTVYSDRGAPPAAKAPRELAWGSFALFVSEPEKLVQFHGGKPRSLSALL